jgi:hypothetical protein
MPQFDFFSFFSQVLWLSFAIVFFYLIFLKFFLTKSSETLKMRSKLKSFFLNIPKGNTAQSLFSTFCVFFSCSTQYTLISQNIASRN